MASGFAVTSMRTTAGSTRARIDRMAPALARAVDGRAPTSLGADVTIVVVRPWSAIATMPPAIPPPTSAPTSAAIRTPPHRRRGRVLGGTGASPYGGGGGGESRFGCGGRAGHRGLGGGGGSGSRRARPPSG